MRVDKFLKVSRLIKRRIIAKDISDAGKVAVNGKTVKPSYVLKIADELTLYLGKYIVVVKVLTLDEKTLRKNPESGYEVIGQYLNAN